MDRVSENSLISGYEYLMEGLSLPDKNDKHVIQAERQPELGNTIRLQPNSRSWQRRRLHFGDSAQMSIIRFQDRLCRVLFIRKKILSCH
jgi:hypothetical protein